MRLAMRDERADGNDFMVIYAMGSDIGRLLYLFNFFNPCTLMIIKLKQVK